MEDNPYRPPTADLGSGDRKPTNNIWWKIFFWISAVLMLLGVVTLPFIEGVTILDYADVILSVIAVVGLFGFAFYRPIGKVVFWRYFFYIVLLESIAYTLLLPAIGYERFGEENAYDIWYAVEVVYALLFLCALNLYAYKRPIVWKNA